MKNIVKYNRVRWRKKTLVSVATEGWIRFEWANARYSQIIPVNWECSGFDISFTACGYSIDDAYNVITAKALEMDVDWLIIIEDDVLLPPDCFVKFAEYINEDKEAVVSGLYYTKGNPSEPLLFRGRGNGCFNDWKLGDKVRVDGLPMGCLLISTKILKYCWNNAKEYKLPDGQSSKQVFLTPKLSWLDPETGSYMRKEGTQDLYFFDQLLDNDVLKKTGFNKLAKMENPFLCDTSIFCKHIDRATGKQYPG